MNKEIRDFMEEKLEEYCSDIGSNDKCDKCVFRNRDCNFQKMTDDEIEYYYKVIYSEKNQKEINSKNIEKTIKQLEKEKRDIENKLIKLYANEEIKKFDSTRDYVGKCYVHKTKNKYYKVISNYSSSTYKITCLCFDLDLYSYDYKFQTIGEFKTDFPNISIDLELFYVEEENSSKDCFGSNFFDCVNEISEEEYEKAMDKKIKQFKQQTFELPFEIESMVNDYKKR